MFLTCKTVATLLLLLELLRDLARIRKSACLVFGVHRLAVGNDVENAATARDQCHLGAQLALEFVRQTGGLVLVVSFRAVGYLDFHSPPPDSGPESACSGLGIAISGGRGITRR